MGVARDTFFADMRLATFFFFLFFGGAGNITVTWVREIVLADRQ